MLVLQEIIAGLSQLGIKAVETLEACLEEEGDPNLKLRAARSVLDQITKLVELERKIREAQELERRMEAIEAALQIRQIGGYRLGA